MRDNNEGGRKPSNYFWLKVRQTDSLLSANEMSIVVVVLKKKRKEVMDKMDKDAKTRSKNELLKQSWLLANFTKGSIFFFQVIPA